MAKVYNLLYNILTNTQTNELRPIVKRAPFPATEALGWVSLTTMIVASATYHPFAKVLSGVLSPLPLIILSELLTVVFVLLTFGAIPVWKELQAIPRKKYAPLAFVGLTSSIIAPSLIFIGLESTTSINATLFSNAEMLFLLVFAAAFLHEKLRPSHFVALSSILVGLTCVALRGFSESFHIQVGDLALLLSGLSFGIGDTVFRRHLSTMPAHTIVLGRSLVAIIGCALLAALTPLTFVHEAITFPLTLLPYLLGFAFLSRFVNLVSFYDALERLPVSVVAIFSYLTVIVSLLLAHVMLGERILPYHIVGGAFIIGGAIFVEIAGHYHASEEQHRQHLRQKRFSRV